MKKLIWITVVVGTGLLSAQTPDFSGVWKANTEKSKGVPPNGSYLAIIEPILPSPDIWFYRNKMEFAFGHEGEKIVLGLHPRKRLWEILRKRLKAPKMADPLSIS